MLFLYLAAAAGSIMLYHAVQLSEGRIYRDQVLGRYRSFSQRARNMAVFLINKIILAGNVTKKLEIVRGSKKTYVKRIFMGAGALFLIGLELKSTAFMLFGFVFGWMWSTISLSSKVKRWRENIIIEIPTLIRMLKIRFAVFDTVAGAVVNVGESLSGPLGEEWAIMVSELENKVPLDTSLDHIAGRIDTREFTSVVSRLKSYYRMGVPEVPFGDMDSMLIQIQAIRTRAQIKRMTTPLMFYAGGGFLSVMLPILTGVLVMMMRSMMFSNIR